MQKQDLKRAGVKYFGQEYSFVCDDEQKFYSAFNLLTRISDTIKNESGILDEKQVLLLSALQLSEMYIEKLKDCENNNLKSNNDLTLKEVINYFLNILDEEERKVVKI